MNVWGAQSKSRIDTLMLNSEMLILWAKETRITKQQLYDRIDLYKAAMIRKKRKSSAGPEHQHD